MNHLPLIKNMVALYRGDGRRIQHFLKVHAFASLIGHQENLPPDLQDILETAALVHDIGIHEAERRHGSSSGKYQELEGPPLAREMLVKLDYPSEMIDRVCYLVAHHHTYNQIEGLDYRILLEADFSWSMPTKNSCLSRPLRHLAIKSFKRPAVNGFCMRCTRREKRATQRQRSNGLSGNYRHHGKM